MGNPRHQPITEHEARAAAAHGGLVGAFALLRVTQTGLDKHIIDANRGVRAYLRASGFHEYEGQPLGDAGRVVRPAALVDAAGRRDTFVSLYRPKTKTGDPRLWISGLAELAAPHDLLALTVVEGELVVTNLSAIEVVAPTTWGEPRESQLHLEVGEPLGQHLLPAYAQVLAVDPLHEPNVDEALRLLRIVAAHGWIDGDGSKDTAVGRTLETALGIPMNSKEHPDLLGCELKAFRKIGNRVSLFSKVPDWSASHVKRSRDLVLAYGREFDDGLRIRHTVAHGKANSYGLGLALDRTTDELHLVDHGRNRLRLVTWALPALKAKLAAKHRRTFWLRADTRQGPRGEQFRYTSARLTRDPRVDLMGDLIEAGVITLDLRLTIRRTQTGGGDSFLFKLGHKDFEALFGPISEYELAP